MRLFGVAATLSKYLALDLHTIKMFPTLHLQNNLFGSVQPRLLNNSYKTSMMLFFNFLRDFVENYGSIFLKGFGFYLIGTDFVVNFLNPNLPCPYISAPEIKVSIQL